MENDDINFPGYLNEEKLRFIQNIALGIISKLDNPPAINAGDHEIYMTYCTAYDFCDREYLTNSVANFTECAEEFENYVGNPNVKHFFVSDEIRDAYTSVKRGYCLDLCKYDPQDVTELGIIYSLGRNTNFGFLVDTSDRIEKEKRIRKERQEKEAEEKGFNTLYQKYIGCE